MTLAQLIHTFGFSHVRPTASPPIEPYHSLKVLGNAHCKQEDVKFYYQMDEHVFQEVKSFNFTFKSRRKYVVGSKFTKSFSLASCKLFTAPLLSGIQGWKSSLGLPQTTNLPERLLQKLATIHKKDESCVLYQTNNQVIIISRKCSANQINYTLLFRGAFVRKKTATSNLQNQEATVIDISETDRQESRQGKEHGEDGKAFLDGGEQQHHNCSQVFGTGTIA